MLILPIMIQKYLKTLTDQDRSGSMVEQATKNTLEKMLQRQLDKGETEDSFIVKQLRRQIAAQATGKTAEELYVTGSVKKVN